MPDQLPENVSTFGGALDDHLRLIFWIVGVAFVLTLGVLVTALWRFRRREGVRARWLPADTLRAQAWVLLPAVVVLVVDLFIEVDSARVWAAVKEDLPVDPDVVVRVTARQFAFSYTYAGPDGVLDTPDDIAAYKLRVPRDRVVRFQLESADVLHSFYIPQLRLKQDIVPGRSIPGWFEATTVGVYDIACAELCGAGHGYMRGILEVETPESFDAWMAEEVANAAKAANAENAKKSNP